ncbi:MAG: hypothetical protein V4714_02640 [Bacteroidota bacterium]
MNKFPLLWIAMLATMLACKPEIRTEAELYQWINDPENGFVQTRKVNDLSITVKYLPAAFLAYKEGRNMPRATQKERDSLLNYYSHSRTFLMTIKPEVASGASGDVIYQGIGNYQEYQQRVMQLNFHLGEYLSLHAGKQLFVPSLSTMENTYGVTELRNFYLVFSDTDAHTSLLTENELDFTFQDEIFNTGISHFVFQKKKIEALPKMTELTTPTAL